MTEKVMRMMGPPWELLPSGTYCWDAETRLLTTAVAKGAVPVEARLEEEPSAQSKGNALPCEVPKVRVSNLLAVELDANMPAQAMRLHLGELTASELRVARAAINWANQYQRQRRGL